VVCLFQPHRYSRTRDLLEEFKTAFNDADVLLVTDVYAASEEPIPGISGPALAAGIRACGHKDVTHVARAGLARAARERLRPGDFVLTLGAGDITAVGPELLELMGRP
jgi:UDP-N-acetylmuramate--alanine ligase